MADKLDIPTLKIIFLMALEFECCPNCGAEDLEAHWCPDCKERFACCEGAYRFSQKIKKIINNLDKVNNGKD